MTLRECGWGVVLARYEGIGHADFFAPVRDLLAVHIARADRVELFVDAAAMSAYETGYRRAWTEWLARHRDQLVAVHILFGSAIVRMGINVVNPLVGGYLRGYSDRVRFESELLRASATTESVWSTSDHSGP